MSTPSCRGRTFSAHASRILCDPVTILPAHVRILLRPPLQVDTARQFVVQAGSDPASQVGIACEGVGSISLVKLVPKLTGDEIRPLLEQLEQIDGQAVTWKEILRNENRFARAQTGKYPNPIGSDLMTLIRATARRTRATFFTIHRGNPVLVSFCNR